MSDSTTPDEPFCSDAGDGAGLGCPACKRFEVRCHPADCPEHGEHQELVCCWCGVMFFAYHAIEHDDHEPVPAREALQ